jgi:hypothetical protein
MKTRILITVLSAVLTLICGCSIEMSELHRHFEPAKAVCQPARHAPPSHHNYVVVKEVRSRPRRLDVRRIPAKKVCKIHRHRTVIVERRW